MFGYNWHIKSPYMLELEPGLRFSNIFSYNDGVFLKTRTNILYCYGNTEYGNFGFKNDEIQKKKKLDFFNNKKLVKILPYFRYTVFMCEKRAPKTFIIKLKRRDYIDIRFTLTTFNSVFDY